MKILICVTGASGVDLPIKFAKYLSKKHEVFVILSSGAKSVLKHELDIKYKSLKNKLKNKIVFLKDKDLSLCVSSGSFYLDACFYYASSDFLAKSTSGYADTLILRSFQVNLKEGRKIIISPRELPMNQIMLENILKLNKLGCIIAPAIYANYSKAKFENFIIGKWCDLLQIEHKLYKKWDKK